MTETGLTPSRTSVTCQRMGVTVTQKEKDEFAAKVKAWRKREGVSQSQGAKILGVPTRSLQGWELATRKPIAIVEKMLLAKMKLGKTISGR